MTRASNTVINVKQVPAAFVQANTAFATANNVAPQVQPAFSTANSAALYANAAFVQANLAFNSANNVAPQIQPAFSTANSAALYANASFLQANGAFIHVNSVYNFANTISGGAAIDNVARDSVNTTGIYANGAFLKANAAFDSANNVAPQIQPAFSTANGAFIQANAAFNAANTISLNKIYKNNTSIEVFDSNTTNSKIVLTVNNSIVGNVSSGNVQISIGTAATSTTTGALQVTGGASIGGSLYVGGTIYAVGDVVSSYSDTRLKEKTRDVETAISIISELNAFYYTANDLAKNLTRTDNQEKIGLSAQEVEKVLPSVVSLASFDTDIDDNGNITSKSGQNYLTVDYARIVPLLIQAIKEQQKEIEFLKEKINVVYNR